MILQGEKISLLPYTIERCHSFYKDYVADPAMTDITYILQTITSGDIKNLLTNEQMFDILVANTGNGGHTWKMYMRFALLLKMIWLR